MNKAAKRRARKRTAKGVESKQSAEEVKVNDPITVLRNQMDRAKLDRDLKAVSVLRQQIWLLQDANAGVRSDITDVQLSAILKETKTNIPTQTTTNINSKSSGSGKLSLDECRKAVVEKKLRKLFKKKEEVNKLKERAAKGEQLEKTQVLKIEREKLIDEQIHECEDDLDQIKNDS